MSSYKIFCFIPAKGASTRLKNKNILKLKGKELIYYPITNAIESSIFNDQIILSTESEKIKKLATKFGAKSPYLRDHKLAVDPYGVNDVLFDFLSKFPKYKGYDACCIMLPTSPLLSVEDTLEAYKFFRGNNYNSVISVTPTDHNSLRSIYVKNGLIKPLFPEYLHKKTQELEVTYRINGGLTLINIDRFLQTQSFFINPIGAYIMPVERSVDIDNEIDYNFAKYLFG